MLIAGLASAARSSNSTHVSRTLERKCIGCVRRRKDFALCGYDGPCSEVRNKINKKEKIGRWDTMYWELITVRNRFLFSPADAQIMRGAYQSPLFL